MATFSIPEAVIERHIGILGKTGSGKSNTAKVLAERIMSAGGRVCVLDPTGTWWGIRLRPDGAKKSKFEPVIFGGNHADIPIAGEHGAAVGEAIATASSSAIIDTRLMTVGARTKFFTAFAEALLRKNSGPLHLIIDEAHVFAPQGRVNDPQSGAMVHAANNLVSLGRGIGLRITLISQRPAKLHKDSLTQVETLIAMRLIAPQDRKAIDDWVGEWADPGKGKEITASLPSLPTGTAWIWSPEIDLLEKVKFPLAATFDSGKPSAHQQALEPIDVKEMGDRLDMIRQDVLANDPARLKRRIAELEKQVAAAPASIDPKAIEAAEQRGYVRGYQTCRRDQHANSYRSGFHDAALKIIHAANKAANLEPDDIEVPPLQDKVILTATPPINSMPAKTQEAIASMASHASRQLATSDRKTVATASIGAERKPLALLAAAYPAGYTEAQWASLAGFKRTGGTWKTYRSRLRQKGMVEDRDGLCFATPDGMAAIGENIPSLPSTPDERLAMWKSKISGVGPMLDALRNVYPTAIDSVQLAERIEMAAGGGTFKTYLSRLRSNGLIEEPTKGMYRLTPAIMGDA